jgi:LacI family transcriptional regulator
MQTLADAAGVSKTTVSLALRNHSSIALATRLRIQALAKELGYRTNPFVSALLSSVSCSKPMPTMAPMAFVSDETQADIRREPRRLFFWRHAQQRASELGYRLDRFWLGSDGMTPRRLNEILKARGIGGIVFGIMKDASSLTGWNFDEFSCASITLQTTLPSMPGTESDTFRSALHVFDQLARRGYRRIGLAMDVGSDRRHEFRHLAALTAFYALRGWGAIPPPLEPARWEAEVVHAWRKRVRPDVVVTVNSELLEWLQAAGLRVPEDIGYASLGVPPSSQLESGMRHDATALCAGAVDLVDAQLRRNERGLPPKPKRLVVVGTWFEGSTLRGQVEEGGKRRVRSGV